MWKHVSFLWFKPGDLVTELDGTPVRDAADLQLSTSDLVVRS
jgi:S1-C subfamily serine protease